jgi:hypothetical protein
MVGTYFGVREGVQSVLIGGVGFLQIILHKIAMSWVIVRDGLGVYEIGQTESTPNLPIVLLQGKHALEVFHGLRMY